MAPSTKILHPQDILNLVNSLRTDGHASFRFGTADHPLSGKECHIYAIGFPDSTIWAVRLPVHISPLSSEAITDFVQDEVALLKRLETCGFSWSPRVIYYNCGFDNPVGYPYIALNWIEGMPLEWTDTIPLQRGSRNKVLRQIGDILLELADCTGELSPKSTATEYLTETIDRKIVRVSNSSVTELKLRDCFILRALVRTVVHPDLEHSPVIISHEDLAGQNIIIDSDYNIKGLIDWGFARHLPLQFAFGFPRFLSIEPPQIDTPVQLDTTSFSSNFLQPSPILRADRQYLISYMSSVSLEKFSSQPRIASFAQSMMTVLSSLNVDWRRLIFEAASSKGLHMWMVKVSWLLDSTRSERIDLSRISLVEEVEGFVTGIIGQKSRLSREMLLDGIKTED